MKNWSFKRKKGKIEGNVRLCLLSGTNQRKQRLWSPKITKWTVKPETQESGMPSPGHPCRFEKPRWEL